MRTTVDRAVLLLVTSVFMLAVVTMAAPFEDEFTVTKASGNVTIKAPGAAASDAKAGQAYPYGSEILTGRRSSVILTLSDGNTVRISAKTSVTIDEESNTFKRLILDKGVVDLLMDNMEKGSKVEIEMAAAICGIVGTKLHVEASEEKNVDAAVITVSGGNGYIKAGYFEILEFTGEAVISTTKDERYTRIRNLKGDYDLKILDPKGAHDVSFPEGYLAKIYVRPTEDKKSLEVTVLIYEGDKPNAKLSQTVSFTIPRKTDGTTPDSTPDKHDHGDKFDALIDEESSSSTIPGTTPPDEL